MGTGLSFFPLGCDGLGRDILSSADVRFRGCDRLRPRGGVASTRPVIVAGLVAGYLRRASMLWCPRVADILLVFPYLVFAIGLMGIMGRDYEQQSSITLVVKEWVVPFRVVSSETLGAPNCTM